VELQDWRLDSLHDAGSPTNDACNRRFSSADDHVRMPFLVQFFAFLKQSSVVVELLSVVVEYIRIFFLEFLGDFVQRRDILEIVEQVECALAGSQILESVIDQPDGAILDYSLVLLEAADQLVPYIQVGLLEKILFSVLEREDQSLHFRNEFVDSF